ncbi:MAG: ATP-binding protein [Pseudomonadota bacterium]
MVTPVSHGPDDIDDCSCVETLKAAVSDLRRSNAELEQFAYVVSHDLREPLRMVSAYSQLLAKRYAGALDADGQEFLHYITDGAHRMERLIDDILTFSRVGRCAVPPQAFPARAAVEAALDDLSTLIAETGADIEVGPLPEIVADRGQIERLFENLVSNALKYRRPDAAPVIRIQGQRMVDCWWFQVSDNGIGIEPAEQDRVFLVFERLHGREVPGTGLGLAICKKIVERHGGSIWLDSTPGEGSTFHFTLARRDE